MSTNVEASKHLGSSQRMRTSLHWMCRLILVMIFGISSVQKVSSPTAFEKVLVAYHFGPVIVHIAVILVPFLEFALTLTLLFGIVMRTSVFATVIVLSAYTVLMVVSMITGNVNHECGCFIGVVNSQSWVAQLVGGNSITIADVIRDLLLILLTVVVWFTYYPKLGLDKFWTNSPAYWRWYRGRGYLAGALAVVLVVSASLSARAEGTLIQTANASLAVAKDFNSDSKIAVGQMAPDFSLSTANGNKYSLASDRGKVVLLEFFAIWCSNCQFEAPIINRIQREFPASKFQVLSVIASPYSRQYEISGETKTSSYTIQDIDWYERNYHVTNPILIDPHFSVTNEYIRQEYPNLIVIDPQGRVKGIYIGPTSFGKLSRVIEQSLR